LIVCPTCQNEELVGTLFCSECGARLIDIEDTPTETAIYDPANSNQENGPSTRLSASEQETKAVVSIKMIDAGQVLPLIGGEEYTIGRISGNQPILPDIDLSPFKAYERGVSRLHATIRIKKNLVTVTDLGSANGTRINGKRINAHEPHALANGDILTLGKFKAQIIIQS
jgi:pSer/pThr/pTyr-binding forkhead associated (FHA) protein